MSPTQPQDDDDDFPSQFHDDTSMASVHTTNSDSLEMISQEETLDAVPPYLSAAERTRPDAIYTGPVRKAYEKLHEHKVKLERSGREADKDMSHAIEVILARLDEQVTQLRDLRGDAMIRLERMEEFHARVVETTRKLGETQEEANSMHERFRGLDEELTQSRLRVEKLEQDWKTMNEMDLENTRLEKDARGIKRKDAERSGESADGASKKAKR